MNAVTLEVAQGWCSQYETTLRGSFGPEQEFPEAWERELGALPPDTLEHAIARYALLKHFYRLRTEALEQAREAPEAALAARQLLRREPVEVEIGGRTVHITGRSYAAMYQIARHALAIRALEAELDCVAELCAETLQRMEGARWRRRSVLRRRLRRLERLHAAAHAELHEQRRALYAHALTPTGAPARSPDEAPGWWEEVGPEEDAHLLWACWEAGPGRYARLGQPKAPKKRSDEKGEDFGWASIFASFERQQRAEPASYYDRDLAQLLAWLRAGAPPVPPELED